MKKIINSTKYLDVIESGGNSILFAKESMKKVYSKLGAVYIELIDDIPYFLDYKKIENPATPGVAYADVTTLYLDVLAYLLA